MRVANLPTIEVIAQTTWQVHWGGCNNHHGGIEGRLTKCSLGSLIFYVRENLARDSFAISSNARIGMKRGEKTGGIECLELCCVASRWEEIAGIVHQLDPMNRPVRRNRLFTEAWASRALAESS